MQNYQVLSVGALAHEALQQHTEGEVFAVFRSSAYLLFGEQLVCLLAAEGPEAHVTHSSVKALQGALHVVLSHSARSLFAALSPGERIVSQGAYWQIATQERLLLGSAPVWVTSDKPSAPTRSALKEILPALERQPRLFLNQHSWVRLIDPNFKADVGEHVLRAASGPVNKMQAWMIDAMSIKDQTMLDSPQWALALLGMGHGLTPSGDDFIGGVLLSLHALGFAELAAWLWQMIEPEAMHRTHAISRAHLRAAASGQGGAAVDQLLLAIVRTERAALPAAIEQLAMVGETSGLDMYCGVVLTCRCWCQVRT